MSARENFARLEFAHSHRSGLAAEQYSADALTPAPGVRSVERSARSYLVLVVDDSASNRRILHDALYNRGHQVLLAVNGLQAVEVWQTHQPDAILMDLQMPIVGGLEATARIRAAEDELYPRRRVPIIAVTQNHTAPDRMSALAAGVDDFLAKPTTAAAVVEAVERLAGNSLRESSRSAQDREHPA